ncbi:hypothetical protein ZWY2020_043568 [Hordeum vulgare]|nr:hypothetical protein ZWY2020_043557 [Hordeum vulgare]KAI5018680.1 hypothetical protein ZWY2020_043568 [Hordeum vulgare]
MARTGAAADALEAGAGAGPSAAEAVATSEDATTVAVAATARTLSFRVTAICFLDGCCCCNELAKMTDSGAGRELEMSLRSYVNYQS